MHPRKTTIYLLVAVATCWTGIETLAQTMGSDSRATPAEREAARNKNHAWAEPAHRWQKANDLIGKNVNVPPGDDVGDVDDIIVDMDNGRIIYYIVSIEDRQVAIPTEAMKLPDDAVKFRLNTTREQLKAQAYDKNNVPDFADRNWATRIHAHYSVSPYWEYEDRDGKSDAKATRANRRGDRWFAETKKWQKASDLIGKGVMNSQNEDLGSIQDLVIDPDAGRVMYGVLSFGGFMGLGDKLFAVPWSSLNITGDYQKFVLNVDKDRLKNATGFDKSDWPNMVDRQWTTEIHRYYGQRPYWEATASTAGVRDRD